MVENTLFRGTNFEVVTKTQTLPGGGVETPMYYTPSFGTVIGISNYVATVTASNTNVRKVEIDSANNRVVITIKNNGNNYTVTGQATLIIT